MLPEVISIFIEILQAIISSTTKTFTFVFMKLAELYYIVAVKNNAVSPAEVFITLLILIIIGIAVLRFFFGSIKGLLFLLFILGCIAFILFTLYAMATVQI